MADSLILTVVLGLIAWSLLGLVLFVVWVESNGGPLYIKFASRWKLHVAYILGGPIVWLLGIIN